MNDTVILAMMATASSIDSGMSHLRGLCACLGFYGCGVACLLLFVHGIQGRVFVHGFHNEVGAICLVRFSAIYLGQLIARTGPCHHWIRTNVKK